MSVKIRLRGQPELKNEYSDLMHEYKSLGTMKRVCWPDSQWGNVYFIPHHSIVKESSSTTIVRVVFDVSMKTSSGHSLIDIFLTSPKLQRDVFYIVKNFIFHRFVFTGDICKMYRQILIRPEDRPFQHILWRETPDAPIQEFEILTVT